MSRDLKYQTVNVRELANTTVMILVNVVVRGVALHFVRMIVQEVVRVVVWVVVQMVAEQRAKVDNYILRNFLTETL